MHAPPRLYLVVATFRRIWGGARRKVPRVPRPPSPLPRAEAAPGRAHTLTHTCATLPRTRIEGVHAQAALSCEHMPIARTRCRKRAYMHMQETSPPRDCKRGLRKRRADGTKSQGGRVGNEKRRSEQSRAAMVLSPISKVTGDSTSQKVRRHVTRGNLHSTASFEHKTGSVCGEPALLHPAEACGSRPAGFGAHP